MTDQTEAPERTDLRIANLMRDVVNEALARYDVPSDVYEQDILIDAACVCAADKIIRDELQAAVAAALAEARKDGMLRAIEIISEIPGESEAIAAIRAETYKP